MSDSLLASRIFKYSFNRIGSRATGVMSEEYAKVCDILDFADIFLSNNHIQSFPGICLNNGLANKQNHATFMLLEADLMAGQEIHFLIHAETLLYTYDYNESAIRVPFYPELTGSWLCPVPGIR